MVPADFSLFPKLEFSLNGLRFGTVDEIRPNLLHVIQQEMYQNCFRKWKRRFERWIKCGGDYFGDRKSAKEYIVDRVKECFGQALYCQLSVAES